jgi:hypothetical protein
MEQRQETATQEGSGQKPVGGSMPVAAFATGAMGAAVLSRTPS